ncbi:cGMP-dependent protein kinase 2, partial [Ophiophagus hannah]
MKDIRPSREGGEEEEDAICLSPVSNNGRVWVSLAAEVAIKYLKYTVGGSWHADIAKGDSLKRGYTSKSSCQGKRGMWDQKFTAITVHKLQLWLERMKYSSLRSGKLVFDTVTIQICSVALFRVLRNVSVAQEQTPKSLTSQVKVTQTPEGQAQPQLIKTLQKGDYFGEKALISDDVRSANIIADENDVECLVIDRETFNQTVGTFEELQAYLVGYVANLARDDEKRHAQVSFVDRLPRNVSLEMIQLKEKVTQFPASCPFEHLEIVATLGVGGFGRVELVKVKNENIAFAMKCIKKKHIVDTKQQEHIHSEKKILEEACSPFIVRGSFDETTTKFCVGCVTEAIEYLHSMNIIYRDLKPENLILDAQGYIKLVDFGFAKKIRAGQKTWTFCGTPEYVAPEVILNKGHDFSVDFWSLGILVYELLTGNPPFTGVDQMMTYNLILKGVERLDFPRIITKRPEDLIRRLCRQSPTERLGNLKNGIHDIKRHRWLNGFNWEGLKAMKLSSPLKRELSGPMDYSHFDRYPPEQGVPPDELSGWDKDF